MREKIVSLTELGPGKLKKIKRAFCTIDEFYKNYSIQEISAKLKYVFYKASMNDEKTNFQPKNLESQLINTLKAVDLIRELSNEKYFTITN